MRSLRKAITYSERNPYKRLVSEGHRTEQTAETFDGCKCWRGARKRIAALERDLVLPAAARRQAPN